MKLTKDQIQKLYSFTEKHFVEWYDVQTELVDHLANGIEAQWQQNSNILFDDALKIEFKKFGVCGFSDVVEEKTKALNKHYWLLIWHYFKTYLKLPKIVLTLFLIWAYFQVLINLPNKIWLIIPTALVLFLVPVYKVYRQHRSIKKREKQTNKKWLFDNISLQLGGIIHFISISFQLCFFSLEASWSTTFSLLFSILIIVFGLVLFISIYNALPQLKTTLAKRHPEYKLV